MRAYLNFFRSELSFLVVGVFWLLALFNPIFKKYDYGAGFPVVIVFCVLIMTLALIKHRKRSEAAGLEKLFLMVFVAFVGLSFLFSQTQDFGFSEVLAFCSVSSFYLIFAHQKIKWMDSFLKVLRISAILAVLMGFFLYFFRDEPRMIGPFFNTLYHAHVWPNAFALFLLMIWPVFLLGKSRWRLLLLAMVFSALLLTYSRGALITFGGQLFLLLIYFSRRINFRVVSSIVFVFLLTVGLFFVSNSIRSLSYEVIDVDQRIAFENRESLTSKQERIDFWTGAFELAKEKPVLGWGPNSFRQAYNPIQKTFLGSADHPHNVFLKIAAENGVVALGGFVLFLISIFAVVASRFGKLSKSNRDLVFILSVSVAGSIAHNLIDYNFNFFVNLFLFFCFLTFIRSLVCKKAGNHYPLLGCILAVVVGVFALYEGSILVAAETDDEAYLESSNFPRNYYLAAADEAISVGDFDSAEEFLDTEISLNSMADRAWYLSGVLNCAQGQREECKSNFLKALKLNPMNDFTYYREYFELLDENERMDFIGKVQPLLDLYFPYVKSNVHFTAYTGNVEAAANLVDLIVPHLSPSDRAYYLDKKLEMLITAEELRKNKTF